MSSTRSTSDLTKFEDVRQILGDLHRETPSQGTSILLCYDIFIDDGDNTKEISERNVRL